MAENIPPEAAALGTPVHEQKPGALRGCGLVLLTGPFLFGLFMIGLAFSLQPLSKISVVAILLGVIVALLGALGFVRAWRGRDLRIVVYEQGLCRTVQGKTEIVRWSDIVHVWQNTPKITGAVIFPTSKPPWTEIELRDGQRFKFWGGFTKPDELGTIIRGGALRSLAPVVAKAHDRGERVSFGSLDISQAGIWYSHRTLPWDQVGGVEVDEGKLVVRQKFGERVKISDLILTKGKGKKWCSVKSERVSNLMLFLAMVEAIMGRTNQGTSEAPWSPFIGEIPDLADRYAGGEEGKRED
jgi:hypothetical protein